MSSTKYRRSNSMSHIPRPSTGDSLRPSRPKSNVGASNVPKKRSLSSSSARPSGTSIASRGTRVFSTTPNTYVTPQSNLKQQRLFGSGASSIRTPNSAGSKKGVKWNDKKNSNENYAKVAEFIHTSNLFNLDLANGSNIKPPTINTFIYVTTTLLEQVTNLKITKQNYVTVLPNLLKTFNYTGNLPASSLKIVSSMHAWPQVMSMWSFLIDLIHIPLTILRNNPIDFENKDSMVNNLLLRYSSDMYVNYNQQGEIDENIYHQYRNELEQILEINRDEYDTIQSEIEKYNAEQKKVDEELDEIDENITHVQKEIEEYVNEQKRLEEELCMEEHSVDQETDYFQTKLSEISEQVAVHEQNYNELQMKIKGQKFDAMHKSKMNNEIKMSQNKIETLKEEIACCNMYLENKLKKLEELNEDIESAVHSWNLAILRKYFNNEFAGDKQTDEQDLKNKLTLRENNFEERNFLEEVKNVMEAVILNNLESNKTSANMINVIKEMETQLNNLKVKIEKAVQEIELNGKNIQNVMYQIDDHKNNINQCVNKYEEQKKWFEEFVKEWNGEFAMKKKQVTELHNLYKKRKQEVDSIALKMYKVFSKLGGTVTRNITEMEVIHEDILLLERKRLNVMIEK